MWHDSNAELSPFTESENDAGDKAAHTATSEFDPLPWASDEERALIAEHITTMVTGTDQDQNEVDRAGPLAHRGKSVLHRFSVRDNDAPSNTPGLRVDVASCDSTGIIVPHSVERQIQARLEVGYSLLCEKGIDTAAILRPGLPSIQFNLSRPAVRSVAQLLCTHKWCGGDLGDAGFFKAVNGEEDGGRRQMWLRDHPALFKSIMDGMGYDCSNGSQQKKELEEKGRFKIRLKGTGNHVPGSETEKNFHADETEFSGCVRVVCVLWGPRTWFLQDSTRVNRWLRNEVVARVRSNRRSLSKAQLMAAKKAAKLKKNPKVELGFKVECLVSAAQCAPVIEPFGMGWDTLTCRKVEGTIGRPTQLIHAVPTSSEVAQFGFGMPGTRGLLEGVQGEISRVVVVFDGLPMPGPGPAVSE